jgi:hypothetical protein
MVNLDQWSVFLQRGFCCTTPRDISVDLSPKPPLERHVAWTTLRQVPVSPTSTARAVVVSLLNSTEVQDHMNRINIEGCDRNGDRIPYYWPPFRKGPPTIFLPIVNHETLRKVQDQTDVKTAIDDIEDADSTTITRRTSYLDELDAHVVDTEDLAPYWIDASSIIGEFLNAI